MGGSRVVKIFRYHVYISGGWRAMAPCVTSPHPETDRFEAKQLRMCLLSKRVVILRQKTQSTGGESKRKNEMYFTEIPESQ